MTDQERFIVRLRRFREHQRIPLDEIAAQIRVKVELLEAFERGELSTWPRGLYARAWIRDYALAVGFDPVETVNDFCRLFPHGDRRAGSTLQGIADIIASPSGYRDEFSHASERRGVKAVESTPGWRDAPALAMMKLVRAMRLDRAFGSSDGQTIHTT
jgi:transcriptional regulator with XRE-family HTH domain